MFSVSLFWFVQNFSLSLPKICVSFPIFKILLCQGSNSRFYTCKASILSLSYIPNQDMCLLKFVFGVFILFLRLVLIYLFPCIFARYSFLMIFSWHQGFGKAISLPSSAEAGLHQPAYRNAQKLSRLFLRIRLLCAMYRFLFSPILLDLRFLNFFL